MRQMRDIVRGGLVLVLAAVLSMAATAQPTNMQSLLGGANAESVSEPVEHVRVSAVWSQDQARPGDERVLAIVFAMDPLWHINPDPAQVRKIGAFNPIPTTVTVEAPPGVAVGPVQFPAPKAVDVQYVDGELLAFSDGAVFYVPVRVLPTADPSDVSLTVSVRYQACNDRVCLPPKTVTLSPTLEIASAGAEIAAEPTDAELFAGYDATDAFAPAAADAPDAGTPGALAEAGPAPAAGLAGILLLAFIGGALLNVMPCVLPVIPIKIMGLVQAAPEPGRRIRLGLAMALGVLAFWIALGVVVASVAGSAISVLFSYWWFNFLLGGLIVALGVGMIGVFSTSLPRWIYSINPRHDSYGGSFGFGIMTAILATPCTGPFMGGAAGSVLTAGPVTAMAVFTAIGLGMALPYFVLSAAPGLVDRLPRTGPASELVKQVLGLLMIAAGVFFVGAGVNALLSDGTAGVYQWYWWASGAVVAAAGLWLIVRTLQITPALGRRVAFGTLGVLLAAGSMGMAYEATRPSAIAWVYYTPDRFEQALAEGNVVLLDFTADWCINCKALEMAVLETSPVIGALAEDGTVAMKVDLTGDNPAGWAKLRDAGRVAIPLLVVYRPDGSEAFKAEVYTIDQVVSALAAARD